MDTYKTNMELRDQILTRRREYYFLENFRLNSCIIYLYTYMQQ